MFDPFAAAHRHALEQARRHSEEMLSRQTAHLPATVTEYGVQTSTADEPLVMPEGVALGLIGKKGYTVFTRQVQPRVEGPWVKHEPQDVAP